MNAPKKIGILGGGQLAWMLALAARDLGHEVWGLIKSPDEPLAQLSDVILRTRDSLEDFAKNIDVLCFESEFFDPSWVDKIMHHNPRVEIRPGLETMLLLRDKFEQKKVFRDLALPQPDFSELQGPHFHEELTEMARRYPKGFVIKRALGGYDGKGNFFVPHPRDALSSASLEFCDKAWDQGSRLYVEGFVDFDSELALVAVNCESRGEFMTYPLMHTHQVAGTCQEVWGPAVQRGLDAECALQASRCAVSIAKRFPNLGCFALEFFWSKDRGLLLNELAPRVHNSGHFTQMEGLSSQFHNHIRAITGEDLVLFNGQAHYVMRNLLGPPGQGAISVDLSDVENLRESCPGELYWYAKSLAAPGRKMGHINRKEISPWDADIARETLESWESEFWSRVSARVQKSLF